jgi:hypothetical protein
MDSRSIIFAGLLALVFLSAGTAGYTVAKRLARGIRNNNPGNLRPGSPWLGAVGSDGSFLIFDTPENGIRALGKTLLTYYNRHGISTVRGIINRWAPPTGRDPATGKTYSQNTEAYITAVARAVGVGPDSVINVRAQLEPITRAIIKHENGTQPYSTAVISEGMRRALA